MKVPFAIGITYATTDTNEPIYSLAAYAVQ